MSITAQDVTLVLSGGVANDDPRRALGGFPSPVPVLNTPANLFPNVSAQQTSTGYTNYRCLYLFNDHAADTMYNFRLWSEKNNESSTAVELGFLLQNETQTVGITPPDGNPPASGSFQMRVGLLTTDTLPFNSNLNSDIRAGGMQAALRAILGDDVTVTFTGFDANTELFEVAFFGVNGNKAFSVIQFPNNNTTYNFAAAKSVAGSPLNTITTDIGDEKIAPAGVGFSTPPDPGVLIGSLKPNEGFPVWLRRTVPPATEAVSDDGVYLRFRTQTFPG